MVQLQTARLRLRPWCEGDAAPLAAICADARVAEFLPAPLTRAISDSLLTRFQVHWRQHGFGPFAVERLGGELVGLVGAQHISFECGFKPRVELLWHLAAEAWGQGLAVEAARAAWQDLAERCDIASVVALTVPENRRSQRVMDKLGLRRDPAADFEHPHLPPGHWLRPHWVYRGHWADADRC